jgi:hypothetical protein
MIYLKKNIVKIYIQKVKIKILQVLLLLMGVFHFDILPES